MARLNLEQLLEELCHADDLLIIQDLDGVCIPLVKDPLTRRMDRDYVLAASALEGTFMVLTNGEHEGRRGVNRLVEKALGNQGKPADQGLYLPGLAAGGVQLQDRFGAVSHPGVNLAEIDFLSTLPERMRTALDKRLSTLMPHLSNQNRESQVQLAVLDTQLSPTINLNGLFSLIPNDIETQKKLQCMLEELMNEMLSEAEKEGLFESFFLHVAPNLGHDGKRERLKPSKSGDVGTTDIQFMLRGAIKEAGLLVLINQHITRRYGKAPLGKDFNARTAPKSHGELLELAKERISPEQMPVLVGVGDTVTSNQCLETGAWLRGGSDRGFLHLIQDLGKLFKRPNRVLLVDSSSGEIDRPSIDDDRLTGISDPEDPLSFDVLISSGPSGYVKWFRKLAEKRAAQWKTKR